MLMDEILAAKPAKARKRDAFGCVPLHYAAKGDKFAPANVEALLKHFPAGELPASASSLSRLPLNLVILL